MDRLWAVAIIILSSWVTYIFTKKTEHMKWIRNNRVRVFEDYYVTIMNCIEKAKPILDSIDPANVLNKLNPEDQAKILRIKDICTPIRDKALVVELYIEKKHKESAWGLMMSIYTFSQAHYLPNSKRIDQLNIDLNKLRKLFQEYLT